MRLHKRKTPPDLVIGWCFLGVSQKNIRLETILHLTRVYYIISTLKYQVKKHPGGVIPDAFSRFEQDLLLEKLLQILFSAYIITQFTFICKGNMFHFGTSSFFLFFLLLRYCLHALPPTRAFFAQVQKSRYLSAPFSIILSSAALCFLLMLLRL